MHFHRHGRISSYQRGFSLVEIALVLMIAGLALGAGLAALGPQLQLRKYTGTQDQMRAATEAIYGFALLNRRLPCPAIVGSNGSESVTDTTTGQCAGNGHGFLPAATLGLNEVGLPGTPNAGLALDAWSFPLRYSVSQQTVLGAQCPSTSPCYPLTVASGIKTANDNGGGPSLALAPFRVCSTDAGAAAACAVGGQLATPTFIVYSSGNNGPNTVAGTDEAENLDADDKFVSRPKVAPATGAEAFDDLLWWQSMSVILSRLSSIL
jgi:prepilin-type N-terminal cleavage/methylation domain-containing protein